MNVVNFAEGILGLDQEAAPVVAKCLRKVACDQGSYIASDMILVASKLESGERVCIDYLHTIGETPLFKTKQLFYDATVRMLPENTQPSL